MTPLRFVLRKAPGISPRVGPVSKVVMAGYYAQRAPLFASVAPTHVYLEALSSGAGLLDKAEPVSSITRVALIRLRMATSGVSFLAAAAGSCTVS